MARAQKTEKSPLSIADESMRINHKAMSDEESKLVKGRFRFYDPPGGSAEFYFKKYKDEPIKRYTLTDDEIHEIPLSVARHINESASEEHHKYLLDENGEPIKSSKRKKRAEFIPLDFN